MKSIIFLLVCLISTGCATSYQSGAFSYTGGYYEVVVNDKITKVVFSGNGFLENETAATYTLFRCAEIAQKQNKPYFLMYDSVNMASFGKTTQEVTRGSIGGKPVTYTYMQAVDKKRDGAISTEEILKQLEESKKRSQQAKKSQQVKKGDAQ